MGLFIIIRPSYAKEGQDLLLHHLDTSCHCKARYFVTIISNVQGWPLLLILIWVAAGGFSYAYYRNWIRQQRPYGYVLWGMRTLALGLLGTLLLNFYIERVHQVRPHPLLVVGVDHSSSIMASADSTYYRDTFFVRLRNLLKTHAGQWHMDTLLWGDLVRRGMPHLFDDPFTNLTDFLVHLQKGYTERPLHGVLLITDGIHNTGASPDAVMRESVPPLFVVGMGDSSSHIDARIASVEYPRTVRAGHAVPIHVYVDAPLKALGQGHLTLLVDQHKVLEITKDWSRLRNEPLRLMLPPLDTGLHKITIRIAPLDAETNLNNNIRHFLIKASAFQHKALLISVGPHPDIGILRRTMSQMDGWEIDAYSLAQHHRIPLPKLQQYDVVVLYELPALTQIPGNALLQRQLDQYKGGIWVVLGGRTNEHYLAQRLKSTIKRRAVHDRLGVLRHDFPYFSVEDISEHMGGFDLMRYFDVNDNLMVLMEGTSHHPIVSVGYVDGQPLVLWNGQGMWQWGLTAKGRNLLQALIPRLMQFLRMPHSNAFRLLGGQEAYPTQRPIRWRFEVKNALGMEDARADIRFRIRKDDSVVVEEWTAAWNGEEYTAETPALPPGIYILEAQARLGQQTMQLHHGFAVLDNTIEHQDLRARHAWLKALAIQTGGAMYHPRQWDTIAATIRRLAEKPLPPIPIRHTLPLIDWFAIGAVILTLLFSEWLIRRWSGYY